jgi:hypothetical protein
MTHYEAERKVHVSIYNDTHTICGLNRAKKPRALAKRLEDITCGNCLATSVPIKDLLRWLVSASP